VGLKAAMLIYINTRLISLKEDSNLYIREGVKEDYIPFSFFEVEKKRKRSRVRGLVFRRAWFSTPFWKQLVPPSHHCALLLLNQSISMAAYRTPQFPNSSGFGCAFLFWRWNQIERRGKRVADMRRDAMRLAELTTDLYSKLLPLPQASQY
jgi:hypothetical protein